MELKGGKLLDKIRSLHGSINLLTYRGNLREVAVECGYIRKDRIQTKEINDEKFHHFCKSYWRALLDAPESNRWNPKRFNKLREKLLKKYKHLPTEKEREEIERKAAIRKAYREKNPPIKQGKVKQIFDESIKESYEQEVLTKRDTTKSGLLMYDKLTGTKLLNEVLKLRHFGKKETSICIITGYEVSNIGVFLKTICQSSGSKRACCMLSSFLGSRMTSVSFAPASSSATAVAKPSPAFAPVSTTCLPSMSVLSGCQRQRPPPRAASRARTRSSSARPPRALSQQLATSLEAGPAHRSGPPTRRLVLQPIMQPATFVRLRAGIRAASLRMTWFADG